MSIYSCGGVDELEEFNICVLEFSRRVPKLPRVWQGSLLGYNPNRRSFVLLAYTLLCNCYIGVLYVWHCNINNALDPIYTAKLDVDFVDR
jgi:hypothetical protein